MRLALALIFAVRLAAQTDPDRAALRAAFDHGQAAVGKYDHDTALRDFQSALAIATKLGDTEQSARSLRFIGLVCIRQSRFTDAIDSFRAGLALKPSPKLRADTLRSLGVSLRA